ncbi:MAG TPA: hypothetical protein VKT77_22325 [Chthonomonadaceae bacterium]|nr:hypothetical protein [Chthonomonadaceae bacterium]
MRELMRLAWAIALAVMALSGLSRATEAQGLASKIAFTSTRALDGHPQIYVMNGDGSSATNLSNNGFTEEMPVFNRLGTKILYMSDHLDGVGFRLCEMDADGSNQHTVITTAQAGVMMFTYSFSPDGSRILFGGYVEPQGVAQIHVMNANGTGISLLAPGFQASYSPNGSKIAFIQIGPAVVHPLNGFEYDLVQVNTDGTGQTILVHDVYPAQPSFSGDGSKLAYVTYALSGNGDTDISVANADGTGQTVIATGGIRTATNPAYNVNPTFSPDGTTVAFESNRSGPFPPADDDQEIWSVNVDGSGLTQLTFATDLGTYLGVDLGISWNRNPSYGPGAVGQPVLVGLALNPATVVGGSSSQGTVVLSSPAPAGGVIVSLASASPNAAVPATVTVPAGALGAGFPIATTTVSAVTVANISAAFGLRAIAPLSVVPPDTLALTRAEYTVSQKQLRLEATSTNPAATLTAYDAATGAMIGNMTFSGGNKFQLQVLWPTAVKSVTLKSSKGGSVTGAVTQHN